MPCTITIPTGEVQVEGDPLSYVEGMISGAIQNAAGFQSTAASALGNIANSGNGTVPVIDAPTIPAGTLVISMPSAPELVQLPVVSVTTPEFETPQIDTAVTLPTAPDFNLTVPSPSPPSRPSGVSGSPPSAPGISPAVVPASPVIALPSPPSLADVSVPDIPALAFPVFGGSVGDAPIAPDVSFEWSEEAYTSALLGSMLDLLQSWVDGANTGIDPEVEAQLWNRARDRESALYVDAFDQVNRDFASRGYQLPPGVAAQIAEQAIQKARDSAATVSRDIAIKQADLEQNNRQFALTTSANVEQALMNYRTQMAARQLEAVKYAVEAAIQQYAARVQQYNAEVDKFKAEADVYRTLIQAEIAKVEVFKAQIEAAKLGVEISKAEVDLYNAQLQGVRTMVSVYEAQVSAARVIAENNRVQVEVYRGQVEAFAETVRAKSAEYQGYEAAVRAEAIKIEPYKVMADVKSAQAQAYAAQARATVDAAELGVKAAQVQTEVMRARAQVFAATTSAQGDLLRAQGSVMEAQARAYSAQVQGAAAGVDAQAKIQVANIGAAAEGAKIAVEAQKASGLLAVEQQKTRVEAAKGTAMVAAQLAAGAMAGISVGAHAQGSFSRSDNVSRSFGFSTSSGCSEQHSYIYSQGQ